MYVVVVKPNYGLLHGIDALMSNFYKPHKGFISFISIATKEIIGISRRKKWIIPSLFMEYQFLVSTSKNYHGPPIQFIKHHCISVAITN